MDSGKAWLVVAMIFGLSVLSWANPETNYTRSDRNYRKKPIHIHQHDGDTTSKNATNIIREEGKYFLTKLFAEYGSGDRMELAGLQKLLANVGYPMDIDMIDEHGEGDHENNNKDSEHHRLEQHDDVNSMSRLTNNANHHVSDSERHKHREHTDITESGSAGTGQSGRRDEQSAGKRYEDRISQRDKKSEGSIVSDGENVERKRAVNSGHILKEKEENNHHHKERGDDTDHKERGDDMDHRERDGDVDNKERCVEIYHTERSDDMDNKEHGHEEHGDHTDHNEKQSRHSDDNAEHDQRKAVATNKKMNKSRRKDRNTSRHKKKRDRSSKAREEVRNKRSALPVIFHTHDLHTDCISIRELLHIFHFDEKVKITKRDFLYISPAVLYQLDKPHCRRRKFTPHHDHNASQENQHQHQHDQKNDHDHSHELPTRTGALSPRVWGYSAAAVVVISFVGLLGVAVIPIMQQIFYNQLLQFLVAMAVGALTGDAMLHLLPHAIAGEVVVEGGDGVVHDHRESVWKGMCGLAGIYFFFLVQRLLTIISGVRNKRRDRKKAKELEKQTSDGEPNETELLSHYCDTEADSEKGVTIINPGPNSKTEQLMALEPIAKRKRTEDHSKGEHSHGGHGHSHHGGSMPKSVSAVAWMVILGDGVHNLSDGLAIGAAFASSVTGGLSTAIAVFCHELPHEIGDFAVLLKSGMSVKQAVLYNCLSSVLCFIGMLVGVALGNIHSASTWIFAGVGGMFIYISLVTMVPELTSVDSQQPLRDLILQCCGICVGSGIMLAIAVYEKDLVTILG